MPVSWPSISDTRRSGVSESRLRKPVSMSLAMFVPALFAEKRRPGRTGSRARTGSTSWSGSRAGGWRVARPLLLIESSSSGKKSDGDDHRRLAQRADDGTPREQPRRRSRGDGLAARRPPRPRASGRSWRGRRRRASARGAGAPRSRCPRRRARARPRRAARPRRRAAPPRPWRAGDRLAEAREHLPGVRPSSPGSRGIASTLGRPISAFSSSGVPSATMWPRSMIPTRSASTSASSRY